MFTKGTKNTMIHHLLYPARPRIVAMGTPYSNRTRITIIQCQRLNVPTLTPFLASSHDYRYTVALGAMATFP